MNTCLRFCPTCWNFTIVEHKHETAVYLRCFFSVGERRKTTTTLCALHEMSYLTVSLQVLADRLPRGPKGDPDGQLTVSRGNHRAIHGQVCRLR